MTLSNPKDKRKSIKIDIETWYTLCQLKLDHRFVKVADAINYLVKENK